MPVYLLLINRSFELENLCGEFAYNTTEDELREEFEVSGDVTSVSMVTDRETGSREDLLSSRCLRLCRAGAIAARNGRMLKERAIVVNEAKPRTDNNRSGGGYGNREPVEPAEVTAVMVRRWPAEPLLTIIRIGKNPPEHVVSRINMDVLMHFDNLDLNPSILKGVRELGFNELTPIQEQAIPPILNGRDVIGLAQTEPARQQPSCCPLYTSLSIYRGGRLTPPLFAHPRAERTDPRCNYEAGKIFRHSEYRPLRRNEYR